MTNNITENVLNIIKEAKEIRLEDLMRRLQEKGITVNKRRLGIIIWQLKNREEVVVVKDSPNYLIMDSKYAKDKEIWELFNKIVDAVRDGISIIENITLSSDEVKLYLREIHKDVFLKLAKIIIKEYTHLIEEADRYNIRSIKTISSECDEDMVKAKLEIITSRDIDIGSLVSRIRYYSSRVGIKVDGILFKEEDAEGDLHFEVYISIDINAWKANKLVEEIQKEND